MVIVVAVVGLVEAGVVGLVEAAGVVVVVEKEVTVVRLVLAEVAAAVVLVMVMVLLQARNIIGGNVAGLDDLRMERVLGKEEEEEEVSLCLMVNLPLIRTLTCKKHHLVLRHATVHKD